MNCFGVNKLGCIVSIEGGGISYMTIQSIKSWKQNRRNKTLASLGEKLVFKNCCQ